MQKLFLLSVLTVIFLISARGHATQSASLINYKVTFYNIQSRNTGMSQDACEKMLRTFSFSIKDKTYRFNQNDNPSYSNHRAIAFLTLKDDQFLEVDDVDTKFEYQGKPYHFTSHLSSITYTDPFFLRGVIINNYCKAAYVVLLDNPKELESTTVKSVSPTSSKK